MAWLDAQLERLLTPDYLEGLKERPLAQVRAMRAECQETETAVSYLRRLAQGRLDIVHAYLDPGDDGDGGLDSLVERAALDHRVGAAATRRGPGASRSQMSPDMDKDDLTAEIDAVLDAGRIAELPTMDDADLRAMAGQLTEIETRISDERRALHERIDKLQAEIVSRYKTGEASVDGLLA